MNVDIHEYRPPSLLRDHVVCYWEGSFLPGNRLFLQQNVVPNGYLDIVIHLSDNYCQLITNKQWQFSSAYTCIGLWDKQYEVRFTHHVSTFAIRFYPESFEHFFKMPAGMLVNSTIDSSNLDNDTFIDTCHRVKEATCTNERVAIVSDFLLRQLNVHTIVQDYVAKAAQLIRSNTHNLSIDDISQKVFISRRQLEREFKKRLGISPKLYMRISRLNEVQKTFSGNYQEESLTSISYALGYADQAHFIRDFKYFTGWTPGQYVDQKEKYIHFDGAAAR